jgi:hypothetical protein
MGYVLAFLAAGALVALLVLELQAMVGGINGLPDLLVSGTVVGLTALFTQVGRTRFNVWLVVCALAGGSVAIGMGLVAKFNHMMGIEVLLGCLLGILLGLRGSQPSSARRSPRAGDRS